MVSFIGHAITWVWVGFLVVWLLASFGSKRTVQTQSSGSRLLQAVFVLAGSLMMFNFDHSIGPGWLTVRLVPETPPFVVAGAAITLAGLLVCFWARAVLGTNWSSSVTIKQNHELVQRGPYQIVRHPIYTGLLIALLGTALVGGVTRDFVGLLLVGIGFWLKSQTEEQFMVQQFGAQYVAYRQHVRALIPFVL